MNRKNKVEKAIIRMQICCWLGIVMFFVGLVFYKLSKTPWFSDLNLYILISGCLIALISLVYTSIKYETK